jgi:hypothetical protein
MKESFGIEGVAADDIACWNLFDVLKEKGISAATCGIDLDAKIKATIDELKCKQNKH